MNDDPQCDLVLEGGVTSAVVYAGFIARLARYYRFVRLGGTSSGSVAAAAAALAQRAKLEIIKSKQQDPQDLRSPDMPFDELGKFADQMAQLGPRRETRLFHLFQPQDATRRGHRIVIAWLRHRQHDWLGEVLATAVLAFPLAALIGALPGLWFIATLVYTQAMIRAWPWHCWISLLLGIALLVGLALLAAVAWAALSTLRGLHGNFFGLCNGMRGAGYADDGSALTPELHKLFNELLGRRPDQKPAVFGEVWGANASGKREVDLQIVTTIVNMQRPLRIPGAPGTEPLGGYFYDPQEWQQLFPQPVMDWLRDSSRLPLGPPVHAAAGGVRGVRLLALPPMRALPIIVAVRMSVAFPGLLSAVPMYTVDGELGRRTEPPGPGGEPGETWFLAQKVWFADGGITSNCPVHLFDAPLPHHPTFAIRLGALADGERRVWLHDDPQPPARVDQARKSRAGQLVTWFVTRIVMTAVNWRDTLQTELPGYRERIVTVRLRDDEGGLNLTMPPRAIRRLSRLGVAAAERLRDAFAGSRVDGHVNAWDRHRWIRLRSTLAAAQSYLRDLNRLDDAHRDAYRALLEQQPSADPRLADDAASAHVRSLLDALAALEPKLPEAAPVASGRGNDRPWEHPAPRYGTPELGSNEPAPAPRLHMTAPW
ncbi:patatin-like phospholipase family protein [Rivibacter subsaxonicus]|uniref:Patatin-like phospholipase n=1 Tax=Rivibacter subsaxonicus TaxID=457575 RepID=A0A4Q7W1X0_9BURK|nr:patatin-like phospholipase family protein [Rivibacter subsaxonicus]RZU02948.1 patatin-like phospholipase [Rivibacter subsaxonicus]